MSKEISGQYNPKEVEEKIYRTWEKSGFFAPEKLKTKSKKIFTIAVPPPNITGSLHMGHALNATIQDILIRKKRMQGYKTLWIPGTDHGGISTNSVVEKMLRKENISRHDLGREKFLEKVWEWREKYGHIILKQFKKLGSSMDWSRTVFTMDPGYQKAVATAFIHYYKKNWIYRAERVINWCPRCYTGLSDLELEHKEEDATLYYIKYPVVNGGEDIIVATVRPETMLGDTAVAVNPKDKRYKHLVGKKILLPIQNREIFIIADSSIEMGFGTGAVKVTPAHDITDAEIALRHKLESIKVIDERGKMTQAAGEKFVGFKAAEARQKVLEELKTQNLLVKEESYRHNISICSRCGTTIEPLPSLQWFVKMNVLAQHAKNSVKTGKVKFVPKHWEKIYFAWLENIRDWPISRQIWWGHRLPVYFCAKDDGKFMVADKKPTKCPFCKKCKMAQSEDVLDTWFSSALWPFATLGWPQQTRDLKTFYPTQVLSTARDIINLWVGRMIYSGLELVGKEPFRDVIIHATILTKDGRRMSKSLGTGIDPMDLIERYGADATRFGLIWQAQGGQDIHWSEEHVNAGRKFANKIWNASRFVLMQLDKKNTMPDKKSLPKTGEDKKILTALSKIQKGVSDKIDKYEFGQALHDLYGFFWHDFCDKYIESAKLQILEGKDPENTKKILLHVLSTSLKLLHPFMPYATEEIWQYLPKKNKKLLLVENWPK